VTLTPLIDVIFLLLLFFMLSSTFTRFAEVPLTNAGGGVADRAAAALPATARQGPVAERQRDGAGRSPARAGATCEPPKAGTCFWSRWRTMSPRSGWSIC
jgi:biopolymer transport protein ExbD